MEGCCGSLLCCKIAEGTCSPSALLCYKLVKRPFACILSFCKPQGPSGGEYLAHGLSPSTIDSCFLWGGGWQYYDHSRMGLAGRNSSLLSLSDVEGKALASAAAEQDSTSAFQPASFTAQTSWDLGHTAEEFCGEIGGEKSSRSCFVRELGGGA